MFISVMIEKSADIITSLNSENKKPAQGNRKEINIY